MKEAPNLSYIKELAGKDIAFEKKFIGVLKEEFPEESQIYLDHIQHDEPRMASVMVHKLKHKFNILSMTQAYELAVQYEEELRVGDTTNHQNFSKILRNIENYLNSI